MNEIKVNSKFELKFNGMGRVMQWKNSYIKYTRFNNDKRGECIAFYITQRYFFIILQTSATKGLKIKKSINNHN